jgi:hypothetical protein
MSNEPTIRELIDACRADHDDLQRPELAAELAPLAREVGQNAKVAAAYEQSLQFDRQVRSALDDVPLPAGLTDRLLAGCEAAKITPATKEPKTRAGVSRRKMLLAGFSLAASLLLLIWGGVEVFTKFNPAAPVSAEQLANSALQWRDQSGPSAKWQPVTKSTQDAFPIDRAIVVGPSRWAPLGPNVSVYELKVGGKRALLFVQRTNRPHAIRNFPSTPLPASGGDSLAAWQRDGFVYVILVTDGSPQQFIQRAKIT